jgi:putative ABC transport system ATP-binding protein
MNDPVIECTDLYKTFHLGKTSVKALKGLSMKINRGEFVGIIGVSGSGKSTLMHLIGALDTPNKGMVKINGENISEISGRRLTTLRADKIGFVFQTFNLLPSLSALDNVEVVMRFSSGKGSKSDRQKKAKQLLRSVGLGDRMAHKPNELSGGERQRVAIARALANDPEILLADEPTGNLDSQTSHEVTKLLKNLNEEKGITVVVVSHDPAIGEKADRTLHIKDGKIAR